MSDTTPLFSNEQGHHLYWCGVRDPYGEHFAVFFTYAANLENAQTEFLFQHGEIEDLNVMTSQHLSWGQVVATATDWSIRCGDTQVLSAMLKAYTTEKESPPWNFLLNAVEQGSLACFELLIPHYNISSIDDQKRSTLARSVGMSGSVDIFLRVAQYFTHVNFEQAMTQASSSHHENMIAELAKKCSAQNVLEDMRKFAAYAEYEALEQWLNRQQKTMLNAVVSPKTTKNTTRLRKI